MRVMEIIRDAEGGMKTHFLTLVKGLAARGVEVIALCNFEIESNKLMKDAGVRVISCPFPGAIKPLSDSKTIIKIVSIIQSTRPDIVHCHGFKAGLVGRLACLITGNSMIYTVHNFITYGRGKGACWLIRNIEGWLGNKTQAIISVSQALKKSMMLEMRIDESRLHVIYNSIPKWCPGNRNSTRRKYHVENNQILIGTVARLIPSKGVEILLRAVSEIINADSHIKLLIVGSGPEESRLKELALKLGIETQVIFTGRVSNIENYYSAFDIFVLPTLTEGLGLTVLEAMSFGLPVIATSVGGIPEWVKHKKNGILVQSGNIFELKTALQFFLNNPSVAAQFGRQAKEDIKKGLTQDKMIYKTITIMENVTINQQRRKSISP